MVKLLFGIVMAASAAFVALAPAGANSEIAGPKERTALPARMAWKPDSAAPGCRVEMRWKHDYAGALYLTKVRICA